MKHILILFCSLFIISNAFAGIDLTCEVETDFVNQNCVADSVGDVGFPSGLTGTGFDIDQICFYYDGNIDDLYVGISAYGDIFFGDADGNDTDGSSSALVVDVADFGVGETFGMAFDLDGDGSGTTFNTSTVDALVGVTSSDSLDDLGVFAVDSTYDPLFNPDAFGSQSDIEAEIYNEPSATCHDLEFVVHNFKQISTHGVVDVASIVYLRAFASSYPSDGVADDSIPDAGSDSESVAQNIFDFDADGIEDWDEMDNYGSSPNDSDSDDDEITDGTEVNGTNPTDPMAADTDADTCDDGFEDANQNGAFEPALGESNPNDTDTDDDGLNDCIEQTGSNPTDPNDDDSDNDGLLDGSEDANHNGVFEPELEETNPNDPDTDDGGVNDGDEVLNGFDPLDSSDDAAAEAALASGDTGFNQVQGGGVNCALNLQYDRSVGSVGSVVWLCGLFVLLACFRRGTARCAH